VFYGQTRWLLLIHQQMHLYFLKILSRNWDNLRYQRRTTNMFRNSSLLGNVKNMWFILSAQRSALLSAPSISQGSYGSQNRDLIKATYARAENITSNCFICASKLRSASEHNARKEGIRIATKRFAFDLQATSTLSGLVRRLHRKWCAEDGTDGLE
jgi:hypothetical protein